MWFVLMADVKDANATPDTVNVSLHDKARLQTPKSKQTSRLHGYDQSTRMHVR